MDALWVGSLVRSVGEVPCAAVVEEEWTVMNLLHELHIQPVMVVPAYLAAAA